LWSEPGDGGVVALLGDEVAGVFGEGSVGVVAELGAGDAGAMRVEQGGKGAEDARLRLSAQAEQDEVVAREDGVDYLRDDGVVVADDAGEQGLFRGGRRAEAGDEIVAELVLDGAGEALGGVFGLPKLAEGVGECRVRHR
jgi:hypothetical protein